MGDPGSGIDDYGARVLANFLDAGDRLVEIPAQRKKRLAILRWPVEDFQPGHRYTETEVNQVITRRHPDFATLRRQLVDEELMQRRRATQPHSLRARPDDAGRRDLPGQALPLDQVATTTDWRFGNSTL
ncbi:MAG: DUF2087 domain-containing protein [Candidatus Dormiibacterota bacterium]